MADLDLLINELNKKYDGIVMRGVDFPKIEKIPFSSPRVNYMTYGGIAIGKATELYGPESGGKTTTALDLVKNAQIKARNDYYTKHRELTDEIEDLESREAKSYNRQIKKLKDELEKLEERGIRQVVYVDAENTLDDAWAEKLGVDMNELILIKPHEQTAEQVLQMIIDITKTGGAILIVLDSIPMLISQQAFESNLDKKTYAGTSGALSEFSQKISQLLHKNNTAFVAINQVREDFSNPYNMYKTPGGRAIKHLFTVRLLIRKGKYIDEKCNELTNSADNPVGNLVDIRIEKTKLFRPDRRLGHYTLNYTSGIDELSDTVDVAIFIDKIIQGGSWFTMVDDDGNAMLDEEGKELKFQGKPNLMAYLEDNPEVFEQLKNDVYAKVLE